MSSVAEIRAQLASAIERTAEAQGHLSLARAGLEETARLFSGLADNAADLPRGQVDRARRDVEDVSALVHAASESLADLDARL